MECNLFCTDTHEFKTLYFEFKLKWHDRKFNCHPIKPILKSQVFVVNIYIYIYLINQARGPIFSQYGPGQAWLIRDLLHDWGKLWRVFTNCGFHLGYLSRSYSVFPSLELVHHHSSCFWKFLIQGWNRVSQSQPSILEFYDEIFERFRPRPPS